MAETLILSVGLDPSILYSREAILRAEGYIVVSSTSIKEAFHLFQDGDFDLMIVDETVAAKDRERLTCLIRASGSRIPIASISSISRGGDVFPEATIPSHSADLVAEIRHLLAKRFEIASLAHSSRPRVDLPAVGVPAATRAWFSESTSRRETIH